MPIRSATVDDARQIAALIKELAEYERLSHEVEFDDDELTRWLFGPHPAASVVLATDDDGGVAGFALWFPTFSTFLGQPGIWLEDLFVRPAFRGRGYGRALLEHLFALADGGRVEWAVLDWNTSAIDFYDSLGAAPVEGWTRYRWTRPNS